MSRPSKPVPMCVVSIGPMIDLMLPLAAGMKLVDLLQQAVEVSCDYVGGYTYTLKDQPNVELTTVKPSQIRARRPEQLAIEDQRGG